MKRSLLWSAKHVALGLLLVSTLISAVEAGDRKFYLTKDSFTGSQALTACAKGFHMASLWEILNVSTLLYKPKRGLTQDDSGSGPPAYANGWIRTGYFAFADSSVGSGNCNAWTSGDSGDYGTFVWLSPAWEDGSLTVSPWKGAVSSCDTTLPVWCVSGK